jgi:hypothetical protein
MAVGIAAVEGGDEARTFDLGGLAPVGFESGDRNTHLEFDTVRRSAVRSL